MASVSSAAREYFGGFSGCRRSRYSRISGRLWKRQPLASATSSTPRPSQSRTSSSSKRAQRVGPSSSSNSVRMSRSGIGCWAQMSAVSRTRLASCVFMDLRQILGRGRPAGFGLRCRASPRRADTLATGCWRASCCCVLASLAGPPTAAATGLSTRPRCTALRAGGRDCAGLARIVPKRCASCEPGVQPIARHLLPRRGQIGRRRALELQRLAARRMREAEPRRMQGLARHAQRRRAAVQRVGHQRMAARRQVDADLVRAAGVQRAAHGAARRRAAASALDVGARRLAATPPPPCARAIAGRGRSARRR